MQLRAGAIAILMTTLTALLGPSDPASAAGGTQIQDRNIGVSRTRATSYPRSEGDQAIIDGWPLYRTERGQTAFNAAMATLKATEGAPPKADAFKGCSNLDCNVALPSIDQDGWIPAGRVWVSPTEYVLFAHSPRARNNQSYRRRGFRMMRYFVFHEFHNGSRNTDTYDTISSHGGSVFVPFYMSKQGTDAYGHRYVVIVQVAPYDVVSIHASNMGSAGPGIEVAKNFNEGLEPLQGQAGIVIARIIKATAPHLKVVNHRGSEGQPMLNAYERHLATVRNKGGPNVALPFVPASPNRIAMASGGIDDIVLRRGASPKIPIAERGIVPPKAATPPRAREPAVAAVPADRGLSPLATYLRANLALMKRMPDYAAFIPAKVAAVAEESPDAGIVYLMDGNDEILGHIEPADGRTRGTRGRFVYVPADQPDSKRMAFDLDLSKPATVQAVSYTPGTTPGPAPARRNEPPLVEPIREVTPPG